MVTVTQTHADKCSPNATHTCYTNPKPYNVDFGTTNATHLTLAYREVSHQEWRSAEVAVHAGLLTAFGEIVMAEDETEYMHALAKQVVKGQNGSGSILEIGFGMGISASFIQAQGCAKHTIIEANERILEMGHAWMADREGVVMHRGFWEHVLPTLDDASFDGVFFDPFPSQITIPFLRQARRVLRPGGRLAYYSDEWWKFVPTVCGLGTSSWVPLVEIRANCLWFGGPRAHNLPAWGLW
jgi:predicted O-methyltransferase YrrM